MIAGCMERMARDACGGCVRKPDCESLFRAFGLSRGPGAPRPRRSESSPSANPFLDFLGRVARTIEAGAKPRETPFRKEVEQQIEPLLASGDMRIDRVARALGVSRQTLYRRLKAEGATFEAVLDGLRRRLALDLIGKQRLSVKEAAYRLGFADPAAFSRAFKRWTGRSPSAMRG